ncbi:MAG: tetratricopeptide repeat protein [bacterium]
MKNNIKWFWSVFLLVFIISCTGIENVAQEQTDEKLEKTVEQEVKLDDRKQKEFEFLFVEALKQKMFGNSQEAIQLLSNCLEIDPRSSAAMYELASIHAANNDYTSASLLLEKAISINSGNKWYKLLLAKIYQQSNRPAEAAEIYDQLLQKDPDNLEYLYMKAVLLAGARENEEAIQVYNTLEEKVGINEQISVAKQQLYVDEGKTDKAFEEIEKLIDTNPDEPKYYGLLADLYQNEGDSVNALKYYRKIQEIDPDNGFVHFSLANYYLQQDKFEKSFEETKKGFRSEAIDIQSKLQLYIMLTDNPGQTKIESEQQETLIDILLEQYPNEFLVHTVYAENLLKKGKLKEARAELMKALDIQKDDYMLWERVLFIDNDLQDWQALYDHSTEAIGLFPNQPQVYFLNAVACVQLEKYEETISVSEEGLDFVIDNPQLEGQFLMLKGEALYKQDNVQDAFEYFDKAVELDKENHIAMNNYAYYLSLFGENLDKAERMSGKVIERFPNNPTYLDTHAWVLFRKGDFSLAKFYMVSALNNGGDENATLLEHYGDILYKLGKTEEALEYWQKAKENGGAGEVLDRKIKERKYLEE